MSSDSRYKVPVKTYLNNFQMGILLKLCSRVFLFSPWNYWKINNLDRVKSWLLDGFHIKIPYIFPSDSCTWISGALDVERNHVFVVLLADKNKNI